MGIQSSLDAVVSAERVVEALQRADDLAFEASREGGARTIRVLTGALAGPDQIVAIAATHALGRVVDAEADAVLCRLLSSRRRYLGEHAAWVLGGRGPFAPAVGLLLGIVAGGGFAAMIAQRTLEQWASRVPDLVAIGLEGALLGEWEPEARRRLVETLGLVRDPIATRPLLAVAHDTTEPAAARVAAVSALGQRRGEADVSAAVAELAAADGFLGDVARIALVDLTAPPLDPGGRPADGGLTAAQLFLHADIDAGLTHAGSGDNGGIATLLVRLGDALVADGGAAGPVERVLTMSRGTAAGALDSIREIGDRPAGHVYGRVPLLGDPVPAADAWACRVVARRGIRRLLRAAGGVDLLHLRMADVGSLAAMDVARELDIPVVFTLAPDPHTVIQSMDLAGRLHRGNFGDVDLAEHFWFRSRLVRRIAGDAEHTVLFPRPELERDMRELVGIDISVRPERHSVVPEGIDLEVAGLACSEAAGHAAGGPPGPELAELRTVLESLPPGRRDLPLIVSVGRFHRVKGMATIVQAWQSSALAQRANLLLVGGDLTTPSPDEQEQLDRIDALVPPARRAAAGLLLPGHRANGTVVRWLAATGTGVPGLAAPRGVYVCGSLKEEFGLALLEAMAVGLMVVAPDGGGPATYIDHGVTGRLTRTWDPGELATAMAAALAASRAETTPDRAARSRATVARQFTIQAMARSLHGVYARVRDEHRQLLDELVAVG